MYEKPDLQRMTGFTADQLNDRLGRLRAYFAEDFQSGKRSKVLVTDRVASALRRMRELEDQGLGPHDAISQILVEMESQQENHASRDAEVWQMLAEELRDRVHSLERDKASLQSERDRLLSMLEDQGEQLRALMPGRRSGEAEDSESGRRERMSRWKHLRAAILRK